MAGQEQEIKLKVFFGKKEAQYYNGLLIKADLGLHEQIAEAVVAKVPKGGKVLDLGAGEGALSDRLADLGYDVVSADMDRESFKSKKATFSHINFDRTDQLEAFVVKYDSSFDAVLGVEVIEHVQDQWKYVKQLVKMAKPGGLVLITTPNITSWLSRVIFLLNGRFHQFADQDLDYGHISPISPWELELILRACEAEDIKIASAGTLPPLYLSGSLKMIFLNLLALLVRPFSKGILDGWCVIATGQKKQ